MSYLSNLLYNDGSTVSSNGVCGREFAVDIEILLCAVLTLDVGSRAVEALFTLLSLPNGFKLERTKDALLFAFSMLGIHKNSAVEREVFRTCTGSVYSILYV